MVPGERRLRERSQWRKAVKRPARRSNYWSKVINEAGRNSSKSSVRGIR